MMSPPIDWIANQLGKAMRIRGGWSCLCPAHDDHKPSLSLSLNEEGTLLAHCYAGCSFPDILSALRARGFLEKSDFLERRDVFQAPQSPKEPNKMALRIWHESVHAEGTHVETYLRSRGIQGPIPPTLRFHPSLFHTSRTYHPAMVGAIAVWPSKTVAGVHRTYLTPDGTDKAILSPNKMMLGLIKGGAVRLSPIGTKLILAEGIETALSCFYATNIPTWSCLSTSGMMDVVVPPLEITQEIIVCADGDSAGQNAADKLAERLHRTGYGVRMAPSPQGQDFNDILREDA
jgi:putative DNA primase/helicase